VEKVFSTDPTVGFVAHAMKFGSAAAAGTLLAPAKSIDQMYRVMFNDYVDATLAAAAVAIVLIVVVYAVIVIRKATGSPKITAMEIGGAAAAGGA
jgi:carbon starvation protein